MSDQPVLASWATWTPTVSPEDEGKAAYNKRYAMSPKGGRGVLHSVRDRGTPARGGSYTASASPHERLNGAPSADPSLPLTGPNSMGLAQPSAVSSVPSTTGSGQARIDERGPDPPAGLYTKSGYHRPALEKTRICNRYAAGEACRQRQCWFAHINGEDTDSILAQLKATRYCPFNHYSKNDQSKCGFKHGPVSAIEIAADAAMRSLEDGLSPLEAFNRDEEEVTARLCQLYLKTRQCSFYTKDQACPANNCIFAHIYGEDSGSILFEIKANRPCPMHHQSHQHEATCAFVHDIMRAEPDSSQSCSQAVQPDKPSKPATVHENPKSKGVKIVGPEDAKADIALRGLVIIAFLLVGAVLAGV